MTTLPRWSTIVRYAPLALMGLFLTAPALFLPLGGSWEGLRPALLHAAAAALAVLTLSRIAWSTQGVRGFLAAGPNLPLLLLLAWAGLSFLLSAPAEGRGRQFALGELRRLAGGASLYFAASHYGSSHPRRRELTLLLLCGGVLAAVAGLHTCDRSAVHIATGAFGNSQLLAAFLVLLLPVAAVFSLVGRLGARRIVATVGVVLIPGLLLLTLNRSAWIGALAGLAAVGLLARCGTRPGVDLLAHWRRRWVAPAGLALAVLTFCILAWPQPAVAARAQSLGALATDRSLQWRQQMWAVGARMLHARPLLGFGLGAFPLRADEYAVESQGPLRISFRQHGHDVVVGPRSIAVPSAAQVEAEGVSLSSLAHNEYLQLGAELGLVGLALYLAVLWGFFHRALGTLRRRRGAQNWLLLAAVGGVTAHAVNGLTNPGGQFGEVSGLFWLLLGVGMAAGGHPCPLRKAMRAPQTAPRAGLLPALGRRTAGVAWALAVVAAVPTAGLAEAEQALESYLAVGPAMITFEPTPVGGFSSKEFTIGNTGPVSIGVEPIVPRRDPFSATGFLGSVPPFSSIRGRVLFRPHVENNCDPFIGDFGIRATWTYPDPDGTPGSDSKNIALSGREPRPAIGLIGPRFEPTRTGRTSSSLRGEELRITNGGEPGSILEYTAAVAPGVFSARPARGVLGRGATARVVVRFHPNNDVCQLPDFRGLATATGNCNTNGQVEFTARNPIPAVVQIPDRGRQPGVLDFGRSSDAQRRLTFENNGERDSVLCVTGFQVVQRPPFRSILPRPTPFQVGRRGRASLLILFDPPTPGQFGGTATVSTNIGDLTVSLTGVAGG